MMKSILFAGGEAMPFAATGGLGDVLGSLPQAIKAASKRTDVRVVMPLHSKISDEWRKKMKFERSTTVGVAWRRQYCGIFSLEKDGVIYYFLDNEQYFKRSQLYGEFDDGERFSFFSYAVLELMNAVGFYPEVLHLNDWQTATAAIAIKCGGDSRYKDIKTVYTIHNIDYQGIYDMSILGDVFGLGDNARHIVEFDGMINLTKGAIECADLVTTVSPRYAEEIQYDECSRGLGGILRRNAQKLTGIINGIDYAANDPATDADIPYAFSVSDLGGKAQNKAELRRRFGLEEDASAPVIAMVSRLAEHKGLELVMCVADEIVGDGAQFVLLGTGEYRYEEFFRNFAYRHPGRAGISISYDRKLSKLIYAGADMFLMPSKSEACGLAQMIASRYGTVPIVRETGGLYDTIKPYTPEGGNGFTFANFNAHDMLYVIREAEAVYRYKSKWNALVKKIMKIDFSWNASAKKYLETYDKLLGK